MGGGPSKDDFTDTINWDAVSRRQQFLGTVELRLNNGRWLSWAHGGSVSNSATTVGTREKWSMHRDPETNMVTFKLPYKAADNSGNYWLRPTKDGGVDVKGQWIWHGAIFWRVIVSPDGRSLALKSMYDTYLSVGPNKRPRNLGAKEYLHITQTLEKSMVITPVNSPF